MRDWFFIIFLGILAAALAGTAAFFSITGLAKLFVGASMAVVIMAGVLEVTKLAIASYLHQYWSKIIFAFKVYLILAVLVLMVITSVGIYGFLSNGYSKTSVDLKKMNSNIELVQSKKSQKEVEVVRLTDNMKAKEKRIEDLSSVRKQQETRLDSLYNKGWYTSARKTEAIIAEADKDIAKLYVDIDSTSAKLQRTNKKISDYDIKIIELGGNQVVGDVGPLKYIASITNLPMDSVVNYLMLILMFVFDPMAVALVIIVNSIISELSKKNKKTPKVVKSIIEKKFTPKSYGTSKIKKEPKVVRLNTISDQKKTQYLSLLEILYKKGTIKEGDTIPGSVEFMTNISKDNVSITEKEVRDFLIVCNLLNIIKMSGKERVFDKNFEEAKIIIQMINQ